ncbi:MAG: hypothetical protein LBK52_03855 [Deltaproteobacteria bacterium]|jgi:N-methylhydantoinase A/oxoprolinase/acetone carboxylase beta subunit|nr:hypothetical protein [Deltaproteobacteria bacterium]
MYLGVDVGGTHTDAVLAEASGRTLASAKTLTRRRVLDSLNEVLAQILAGRNPRDIERLTVSTTLGLNSVLTGTAPRPGILVTGGPGLDLDPADWGPWFRSLPGQQDHRGRVTVPLEYAEALKAARELARETPSLVCASKFGPKNPALEDTLFQAALAAGQGPVLAASRLFGRLNWARRLGGTVLNASVLPLYQEFLNDLEDSVPRQGLTCPIHILKADGGVMSIEEARVKPVLALAAGPAASLLGLWALAGRCAEQGQIPADQDLLMIDMGGTSTDLAVFSQGPLLTPEGLTLAGRPTLVRGLLTHSLALGGDTDLVFDGQIFETRPIRRGPALAWGSGPSSEDRPPTLTDALNTLGACQIGRTDLSRLPFAQIDPQDPRRPARQALEAVLARLKEALADFLYNINRQPAYTLSAFLVDWHLNPKCAMVLGGPAPAMAPYIAQALNMPAFAPPEAASANALGAALAKPTAEAELYADTAAGTLSIPTLSIRRQIDRTYTLDQAKGDLLEAMDDPLVQITEAEVFNQVSDYGSSGRVMRVRAQSAPGLVS